MDKTAILIVNYNMRERADALYEHIVEYVEWPYEIFSIDNGSDLVKPSKYANVRLENNVQTTGGWLAGLEAARSKRDWFAYWFLITSTEFVEPADTLTPMVELLVEDDNAVGVHPALTDDSTSDWPHLFDCGSGEPRRTWHIDTIAALYRAEWFDEVGGFDPRMTYAWGIDLDMGWQARQAGRGLYVHEDVQVKKVTDIGYKMGRMNMTADERRQRASGEMAEILADKYGPSCWQRVTGEFITEAMLMPGNHRWRERASAIC
jgi:GT2 family glycosyltransferase